MKLLPRFLLLFSLFVVLTTAATAGPVKITSGQLFIGGSSYGTENYQTYLRFELNAQTRIPRRDYVLAAEQTNAVFMNHPVRPAGEFDYKVGMPYHSSGLWINQERFFPVWYAGCIWRINADIMTPTATIDSPQFVIVSGPFTMNGGTEFYGAVTTGFRISGSGTAELKFEKFVNKYYLLEARYLFGTSAAPVKPVPTILNPA